MNAVIGERLLPDANRSETSLITYVVPRHAEEERRPPVLQAHVRNDAGQLELRPVAEGAAEVLAQLRRMNRSTGAGGSLQCTECRVECSMRSSLNEVFVPRASEWEHVQLLDIGGPDESLNCRVQACADIAYALSHRVLVCVRHDTVSSKCTLQLVRELRTKAPYHFSDDLASRSNCPLVFLITQVDLVEEADEFTFEELRQTLRALLQKALPDCPVLVQSVPVFIISSKNSFPLAPGSGVVTSPVFDWGGFEECLILFAATKREIIAETKCRRASFIHGLGALNLQSISDEWPCYASSVWGARRDLAIKVGLGAAVVASGAATAVAAGVFVTATASAATATAGAEAAAAGSSWWAWFFGVGTASAKVAAYETANAALCVGKIAGLTTAVSVSAATLHGRVPMEEGGAECMSPDLVQVAGMSVASAAAVGAKDACTVLRHLRFTASPSELKDETTYSDVHFYPAGAERVQAAEVASLVFPFELRSCDRPAARLATNGSRVRCNTSGQRADQLWWIDPGDQPGTFALQSLEHLTTLRAQPAGFLEYFDSRLSVSCTSSTPPERWCAKPGSRPGTVRFQHVEQGQSLYFNGMSLGCFSEPYPDQDWIVVPVRPLYIGDFKAEAMTGEGQIFWPNGSPLFKGTLRGGSMKRGFVFDERSVCHGHFRFGRSPPAEPEHGCATPSASAEEPVVELDGQQPEDAECTDQCALCGDAANLASLGWAIKPCGHGTACEACAVESRECPWCRTPVQGTMRLT